MTGQGRMPNRRRLHPDRVCGHADVPDEGEEGGRPLVPREHQGPGKGGRVHGVEASKHQEGRNARSYEYKAGALILKSVLSLILAFNFILIPKQLSSPSPKSGPLRPKPKPKAVLNPNPSPIGTGGDTIITWVTTHPNFEP